MGRQVGRLVLPAPSELMQSQNGNFFTGGNKVNFSLCATQTYFPSAASTAAALTQSKGNGGFLFPFFPFLFREILSQCHTKRTQRRVWPGLCFRECKVDRKAERLRSSAAAK